MTQAKRGIEAMSRGRAHATRRWPAYGWRVAALLAAGAAPAQLLVPVQQPSKSPLSEHVYFSRLSLLPRDPGTAVIQFDIGWTGSWRHDVNHDAACGITELRGPMWCTSCRLEANLNDPERGKLYGFRAARTAPEAAKWNSVRQEEETSPVLHGLPGGGR